MLADNTEGTMAWTQALVDAYVAKNPNVTISVEWRPGGGEGDNIVKTRLATGEMADIFRYNSGSLFQALNPTETLVDLSAEPFIENVSDSFLPSVSAGDGIYGVPLGTAMGGGILYNKKVYADLGLEVPTTWEAFAANNEAIKAAGIAPVAASFADTWTSQLFVLSDYFNVQAAEPDFAERYTNNQAKHATSPAALAGFLHTQEGFDKGWWQEDYDVTTYGEAVGLLALMELQASRAAARTDADGNLVLLADQDRSRWDRARIARGLVYLDRAGMIERAGAYRLQAAIAACHARASSWEATDWPFRQCRVKA
jgi:raffinose/stachyose/melibiose transport system substrate-binding protein